MLGGSGDTFPPWTLIQAQPLSLPRRGPGSRATQSGWHHRSRLWEAPLYVETYWASVSTLTAALHPQVPLCCPDLGRGEEVLSPGRVQPPAGLRPRGSSQGTAVLWTVRAHSLSPAGEESDRGLAEGSWLPPRDVRCLRPAPPSNGVLLGVTKRSHPQPGMSSPSQIPIETGSRSQSGPQEAFPRIGAGVGELFMGESGREI